MSKTLDCEFKCGSILPPCVFDQLWEPLFSFPRLSLAKWEKKKKITSVRRLKPLKPCFNFYGLNKSGKPKLNLFLNPTVHSLFCITQPADSVSLSWTSAFLRPGANSDAKRGQKVVSLRVEVLWRKWSGMSTSPWATTLSQPGAGQPRARCSPCLGRELLASKTLLLPSLSWVALPFPAAHVLWMGCGRRDSVGRNDRGCCEGVPCPGEAGAGTIQHKGSRLPPLWFCGLSIHLLTVKMERQSALRLFNSFSIFFQHWKNNF